MSSPSQSSSLRVVLVDTAPRGQKGSMSQYGDMVEEALSRVGVTAVRIHITLAEKWFSRVPIPLKSWIHHATLTLMAATKLSRSKADVFHILDGSYAYVARWVKSGRIVATSHDLIPVLQAQRHFGEVLPSRAARYLILRSLDSLRNADHVVAVSSNTACDLARVAGIERERITVIYHALPSAFVAGNAGGTPASWQERRYGEHPYVLHVGNNAFYKNRAGVLRIFARIRKTLKLKLRLAGPPPTPELLTMAHQLDLAEDVEFIVDPDSRSLVPLYSRACVFLFPSLYEGFGWPPLEAMSCGCPVVCSNAASLPEVTGDAALCCPPGDEKQMADHCLAILNDDQLAKRLMEKGFARARCFSLERMGNQLLGVYMNLVGEGNEPKDAA